MTTNSRRISQLPPLEEVTGEERLPISVNDKTKSMKVSHIIENASKLAIDKVEPQLELIVEESTALKQVDW